MIVYVDIVRLRKSVQLRSEVHKRNPFSLSLSALLESKSEERGAPNQPMIFGLLCVWETIEEVAMFSEPLHARQTCL